MKRNIVILLGGPGAGKGTQAVRIKDRFGLRHISTGQLLRSEVAAETQLGLCAKCVMEAGGLVGDEIVNELLTRRISQEDCSNGFVLDGYPRDIRQAVAFKDALLTDDRLIVIDIDIDLERVIPRLTGRRTCTSCNVVYHAVTSPPRQPGFCDLCGNTLAQRSDDREDVIRARFDVYCAATKPLTELYEHWGVYRKIDGMQHPDAVARDIEQLLGREIHQTAGTAMSGA